MHLLTQFLNIEIVIKFGNIMRFQFTTLENFFNRDLT